MSTINRIRFVNINYNNGACRIGDETFCMNGESTLISLANGGGKSVMVQLITALFVHPKYRSTRNRPFQSYFTGRDPSFIMVEWKLDQGAGYVLCGMMVRKNQDPETADTRPLDVLQFISEYSTPCLRDIENIEIIDHSKKAPTIRSYGECRRIFQQYRQDGAGHFFTFVMPDQAKNYFDMLESCRIYSREWESIIRVINQEEGGLVRLFRNCQDEQSLIRTWFLPTIERKINVDGSRIDAFRQLTSRYVGSYYRNRKLYERKSVIADLQTALSPVQDAAYAAMQSQKEEQVRMGRLGALYAADMAMDQETARHLADTAQAIEDSRKRELSLTLEKLSDAYYDMADQLREHQQAAQEEDGKQQALAAQRSKTQRALQYLELSQLQKRKDEEVSDQVRARAELDAGKVREQDTSQERSALGRLLYAHTSLRQQENQRQIDEAGRRREDTRLQMQKFSEAIRMADEQIRKGLDEAGALRAKIAAYDEAEDRFNRKYKETFQRTLTGEYEPGFVQEKEDALNQMLAQAKEERKVQDKQKALTQKNLSKDKESLDALTRKQRQTKEALFRAQEEQKNFAAQRDQRLLICQHLGITEEDSWDTQAILGQAQDRAASLDARRIQKDAQRRSFLRQKERLESGRSVDLPPEIEKDFHDLGISYVQGLEWMKNNGNREEENRALTKAHPFLPYALILEEADIRKLEAHKGLHHTSVPIPMIERAALRNVQRTQEAPVVFYETIQDTHFYLYFDGDLLNEEKAAAMIQEKQQLAEQCAAAVSALGEDYQTCVQWIRTIADQTLTRQAWDAAGRAVQTQQEQVQLQEEEEAGLRRSIRILEKRTEEIAGEIQKSRENIAAMERRQEAQSELFTSYTAYLDNRRAQQQREEEIAAAQQGKEKAGQDLLLQQQEDVRLQLLLQDLSHREQEIGEAISRFAAEKDNVTSQDRQAAAALSRQEAQEKEARYTALTEEISSTIRELERRLQDADARVQRAERDLKSRLKKFGIAKEEWDSAKESVVYSEAEEEGLRARQKEEDAAYLASVRRQSQETSHVAALSRSMQAQIDTIRQETGNAAPMDRSLIVKKDFAAEIAAQKRERSSLEAQQSSLQSRRQSYENVRVRLAEFADFMPAKDPGFETAPEEMAPSQLISFTGEEVSRYRKAAADRQQKTAKMQELVRKVLAEPEFADPYYHNRLEGLPQLWESGQSVYRQLQLLTESAHVLIQKLEVDLRHVEDEKKSLEDQLFDYVRSVHENLREIDRQTTITIQDKPVKMLTIQMDDWEKNEVLYENNLQAFIDQVTQEGMKYLEEGKPSDDYYGHMITTAELYDRVVHIATVRILLYKVEQRGGRRISWSEVARNSGGEGFLSAFVVLESLLDYMRRDKTDLFGQGRESKVLLMDNPFGSTNAAHLLQPMIAMARKTNTQLLCFTGIGGDSVYSIFDNIYACALVSSRINNGLSYLQKNHIKGDDPQHLMAERIQVVEQISLDDLLF